MVSPVILGMHTKPILIEPMYGMPASCFDNILEHGEVVFELGGWYRKRTYRNRAKILSPQGNIQLSIPLKSGKNSRTPIKDVRIDYSSKWQTEHYNAFKTAYNSTPFFSLLHPEFAELYQKEYAFLIDFQLKWWETILEILQVPVNWRVEEHFIEDTSAYMDLRDSVQIKEPLHHTSYYQLFSLENTFQHDLFIMDRIVHIGR